MYLRIALCTPLLAFSLSAQDPAKPQPAGQEPTAEQPAAQDPQARLEELNKERARLEQEIRYAKERAANAKKLLKERLDGVEQQFKSIDAGAIVTNKPAPRPQRKFARVAGKDEMERHPEGTLVVVEGRAIGTGYFDRVMNFMRESTPGADENLLAQRVLFDMIRIESVAAPFFESEGEADIGDALLMLQQDKTIDDVIAKYGTVRGADEKGVLTVHRNSVHGPFFEHMAFGTAPGQRAAPFRNVFGYVLLEVVERQKGETSQQDTVVCKVAQIDYTSDAAALSKAQMAVNTGQLDIVARDEETLKLLPVMFLPPEQRAPTSRGEAVKTQHAKFTEQLQQLEEAGEGESEAATKLRAQIEQLEKMMRMLREKSEEQEKQAEKPADGPKAPEAPVKK